MDKDTVTGLTNFGKTGWLNAVIQILFSCEALRESLLDSSYKQEINLSNPLGHKGKFVTSLAKLCTNYFEVDTGAISPSDLLKVAGECFPQLSGHNLQDASEVLSFFLDAIHEDLNRVQNKPHTQTPDRGTKSLTDFALDLWKTFKLRNDSLIVDAFGGQYYTRRTKSEKVTEMLDAFTTLSLSIPDDQETVTLHDCLNYSFREQYIDKEANHTSKQSIYKTGLYLFIVFKRFRYNGDRNMKSIDFDPDSVDLSDYIVSDQPGRFNLVATIDILKGNLDGVYISKVKRGDTWYRTSDEDIRKVDDNDINKDVTYVLLYKREDA